MGREREETQQGGAIAPPCVFNVPIAAFWAVCSERLIYRRV